MLVGGTSKDHNIGSFTQGLVECWCQKENIYRVFFHPPKTLMGGWNIKSISTICESGRASVGCFNLFSFALYCLSSHQNIRIYNMVFGIWKNVFGIFWLYFVLVWGKHIYHIHIHILYNALQCQNGLKKCLFNLLYLYLFFLLFVSVLSWLQ